MTSIIKDIFCCEDIRKHIKEEEVAIVYSPKFRAFGLRILDGGSSTQDIHFCPWCGCKLPEDLSNVFFTELSRVLNKDAGLFDLDQAPPEFKTDEWWIKRGYVND